MKQFFVLNCSIKDALFYQYSSMSFMLTVESKLSGAVDTRCIMFYCDIFTFDVHITLWPHQYS